MIDCRATRVEKREAIIACRTDFRRMILAERLRDHKVQLLR